MGQLSTGQSLEQAQQRRVGNHSKRGARARVSLPPQPRIAAHPRGQHRKINRSHARSCGTHRGCQSCAAHLAHSSSTGGRASPFRGRLCCSRVRAARCLCSLGPPATLPSAALSASGRPLFPCGCTPRSCDRLLCVAQLPPRLPLACRFVQRSLIDLIRSIAATLLSLSSVSGRIVSCRSSFRSWIRCSTPSAASFCHSSSSREWFVSPGISSAKRPSTTTAC